MKALLIYPEYPGNSFWSFKYAIKFVGKRAAHPPLGLPTIAAMLPNDWKLKLVDMNIEKLRDKDIKTADYVFVSAMISQLESVREVIRRCKKLNVKIVAGGPLFTSMPKEFSEINYLVLNEAEITLPLFLVDLKNGEPKHLYSTAEKADISRTPIPRFDMIKMKQYVSMNIQYSRGCPWNCEFCDITALFGHVPRTKTALQIITELESLYRLGWRGSVFVVDDNFIGNKSKLKTEILPAFIKWSELRRHPFTFFTEADIALADDDELLKLMVQAGFDSVFIGIESPNKESLAECNKIQNKNRDLIASVKKIQRTGLEVQAGFIVGFDSDPDSIFDMMIEFIQKSRIGTAMVGLLNALPGTRLYQRLKNEGRLVSSTSGNNTDFSINFIPKMDKQKLIEGYRRVVSTIYSPKNYYERIRNFLKDSNLRKRNYDFQLNRIGAGVKSIFRLGIIGKERVQYWKLFFWTLFKRPGLLSRSITSAIFGFHFRKVFKRQK